MTQDAGLPPCQNPLTGRHLETHRKVRNIRGVQGLIRRAVGGLYQPKHLLQNTFHDISY